MKRILTVACMAFFALAVAAQTPVTKEKAKCTKVEKCDGKKCDGKAKSQCCKNCDSKCDKCTKKCDKKCDKKAKTTCCKKDSCKKACSKTDACKKACSKSK